MDRSETTISPVARRDISGSYIDWAAILAGAVVAAAIAGLFTTFGAVLGFSTMSVESGGGSFNIWLIVTALWIIVTLVMSYLAGGYVAGRMRRRLDEPSHDEASARDGINGLVVWGIGMLISSVLMAGVVGGAASAVGTAATAAGSAVGGVAQGLGAAAGGAAQGVAQAAGAAINASTDEGARDYFNDRLMRPAIEGARSSDGEASPSTPSTDNAELARQTGIVLGNVLRTGEISSEDRDFLIAAVAQRTELSKAEVEERVDQAVTAIQDARAKAEQAVAEARAEAERLAQEAEEMAIAAAETARKSAILTALLLTVAALMAGLASVAGAVHGGRHRDEGRVWGGFTYRI